MPESRQEIQVNALVHTPEGLKDVDELSGEQKRRLGSLILTVWMNELFRGRAVFTVPEDPSRSETGSSK